MGLSLWEVLLARPNIVPALEEFSFVVKQRAVVVCAKGIDSWLGNLRRVARGRDTQVQTKGVRRRGWDTEGRRSSVPGRFIYHLIYSSLTPEVQVLLLHPLYGWENRGWEIYIFFFLPKLTQLVNGRIGEKINSGSKLLSTHGFQSNGVLWNVCGYSRSFSHS